VYAPAQSQLPCWHQGLSGLGMGAPGLGNESGLLRVGAQKWGFTGLGRKGGCEGCDEDEGFRACSEARQGSPRAPLGRVTLRGGYNLSRLQ
jgi:hypothetical protein